MVKPKGLKVGDTIGIISPSSFVTRDDIRRGMNVLKSIGFNVRLGKRALNKRLGYQAGTREDRLSDLHAMFADDEVKGVFCTTGGYSSVQLLPDIDWDLIRKNPKVFIGYSDITTLLNPIYEKTGLVTFHGPLVEGFGKYMNGGNVYTIDSLKRVVMNGIVGRLPSYTPWKVLKSGNAIGALVGGNLNILLSLLGTPHEPVFDGKILFIEEIDDTDESIENYLWRLRVAGVFDKIRGMVIGKFTKIYSIKQNGSVSLIRRGSVLKQIFLSATEKFDFPILYSVDFGHYVPMLTLPIGARAKLDCPATDRVGSLSIVESYLS